MTRPPHPAVSVIPATAEDLHTLSQVIADAFHDLAPSRWLIADPAVRRDIFPGYFRVYVEHAFADGTVHTTTDRTAAALWLPVAAEPAGPPAGYQQRLAAATAPWTDRFLAFDDTLDRHHPAGEPHHHLAILAVQPGHQGRGTGTALLRAYHDTLDQTGTSAYLEASDQRNQRFYQRHGYTPLPGAPFHLPDGGPPMWPMMRPAKPHIPGEPADRTADTT